jgi:hypothetical protein
MPRTQRGIWAGFDGSQKPPPGWEADADHPLSSSLLALWPINEGAGGKVGDASGGGRDGAVAGTASWKPGQFGPAFSFDGSTTINFGAFAGSAVAFWFWVCPSSVTGDIRLFSQTSHTFAINQGSGESGSVWGWNGGAWLRLSANNTLAANAWYHLALVFDGSGNCTLYINGQSKNTIALGWDTSAIRFADTFSGFGTHFVGLVDAMGLAGRAPSAAEVRGLYTTPFDLMAPPLPHQAAPRAPRPARGRGRGRRAA